jgi:hypothetical protein
LEIFVGREDDGIGKRFGHADEASIGEAHWDVRVFLDQLHDWLYVLGKREGDEHSAAAKYGAEIGSTALPEKMKGLRQNSFARGPRRRHLRCLRHSPFVVSVSATKQCYNKSSINEDVSGHNRWRANIPSFASLGRPVNHLPIQ